jgi:UDP-N-acetylmuramoylalanine--D-glutamate ligase
MNDNDSLQHPGAPLPQRASSAPMAYPGLRVVVLGLARQGIAASRFFLTEGARITISDMRSEEQLAAAHAALERYVAETRPPGTLHFALGGHPLNLLDDADLLCLSGGVSPAIPIVQEAAHRGIPLTNDGLLTLEHCRAPIVGLTGSAGKTTTTTLVGLMLEAAGRAVHVGGNIGTPLLDRLAAVGAGDRVVMELSSFQLELFDRSPSIAALLNITPNHLDRHPSMSHYAAAKANILRFQNRSDTYVLNADDAYTGPWLRRGRCEIPAGKGQDAVYFPLQGTRLGFSLVNEVEAGAFLRGDALIWRRRGEDDVEICRAYEVRLRGRHNLANILAACCVAGAAGADAPALRAVATTFGGVAHRLQIVRERNGVLWINDSIATAPERTVAALHSFDQPIIALLGGRDKQLPWAECAAEIHGRRADGQPHVRHAILFGEAADLIAEALAQHTRAYSATPVPVIRCADLPEAVDAAARVAQTGDVVLLAPGGTSFDAYDDFAARGQHFVTLVEALP